MLWDGKTVVVFEGGGEWQSSVQGITFWDMRQKQEVKRLSLPSANWTTDIRLIEGGKKAVLLAKSRVSMVRLE